MSNATTGLQRKTIKGHLVSHNPPYALTNYWLVQINKQILENRIKKNQEIVKKNKTINTRKTTN